MAVCAGRGARDAGRGTRGVARPHVGSEERGGWGAPPHPHPRRRPPSGRESSLPLFFVSVFLSLFSPTMSIAAAVSSARDGFVDFMVGPRGYGAIGRGGHAEAAGGGGGGELGETRKKARVPSAPLLVDSPATPCFFRGAPFLARSYRRWAAALADCRMRLAGMAIVGHGWPRRRVLLLHPPRVHFFLWRRRAGEAGKGVRGETRPRPPRAPPASPEARQAGTRRARRYPLESVQGQELAKQGGHGRRWRRG